MRGADILVKALVKAGVTRIFSLSGNQIMPVYDACLSEGVEIIHTRHEAAAVYMAEAYAQLTGTLGVALVTAGAGAANAMGPLFTASESETPVLLLTGDSPVRQDGMGTFQEMPQVPMIAPLTKMSVRPHHARDLAREIARASRLAQSGRPGPVHVALGFDVVNDMVETGDLPHAQAFQRHPMTVDHATLQTIMKALSKASRPVVICGPLMNATRFEQGAELADALGAPVIPMESPRGLRDPALGNIRDVLGRADLIVNMGKRVDFTLSFGQPDVFDPSARWIVVQPSDVERDRAYRNLEQRLMLAVAADPRDVARCLIAQGVSPRTGTQWRETVTQALAARSIAPDAGTQITSAQLCEAVQRQIARHPNAIAVCDGGEFGQWAQAGTRAKTRIVNGVSGAIGGGLCYGIAAGLARPGAPVFSLMGDGTVGFHIAEFETAARQGISCVVVIGNDKCWNAEHQIQMREYGPDRLIGCDLSDARYDLAAAALGAHAEYVTKRQDLDAALARAVDSGKPACVNVIIEGLPAPSMSS